MHSKHDTNESVPDDLYRMGDEQQSNQQKEFLYSKRLACSEQTFQFLSNIYDRILKKTQSMFAGPAEHSRALKKNLQVLKELKERLLPQALFAHRDTSYYHYRDLHGSVGEHSPLFFEALADRSNAYFDIMFTAITNAIFQYNEKGLIKLFPISGEVPDEINDIRQYRRPSTIPAPRAEDELLLPEEKGHYKEMDNALYASRGEHQFQLANCAYTDRASVLKAPVLTGISGDTYLVFKFITLFLDLNQQEFVALRKALIAYLVASRDHSLVEVIDATNLVLNDPDFAKHFDFNTQGLTIKLDNCSDYQQALQLVFEDVTHEDELTIQKTCMCFLEKDAYPKWVHKLIHTYVSKLDIAHKPMIEQQTLEQISNILQAIAKIDASILRENLYEDQYVWSITSIESIVDLYCAAKFSDLPLKILGEGSIVRGLVYPNTTEQDAKSSFDLMKNFGLSATRLGVLLNFASLAERAKLSDVPVGIEHVTSGTGAILSSKEYTPLLNIVWMIASAQNGQEVFIARQNEGFDTGQILSEIALYDDEHHRPTMLCFELATLAMFGYEATNIRDHGLAFSPPEIPNADLGELFQSLEMLSQMSKETLVQHVNGLFLGLCGSKVHISRPH